MHQLELLGGAVEGLTREGPVLQPSHHTGVTQLIDVVDAGHAANHLLVAELLQGFEMKVPKTLVPAPRLIIPARGKTQGVRHLYMEHIKAVASPVHLGEKTAASILDAQHAVLILHPRAILVQLLDADDGVLQGQDVVHPDEKTVLPCLGLEDDQADALDLDGRGITELDGALHVGVQVREELASTSHVVHGTGVEVSVVDLVILGAFA